MKGKKEGGGTKKTLKFIMLGGAFVNEDGR